MNTYRYAAVGIVSVLVSVFLSGCWSSLELRDSSLVMGTALDKAQDGYRMSVELLQLKKQTADQQGSQGSLMLTEDGANIHDAARKFIHLSKSRLVFTHNRVWMFTEAVAREDILTPLDVVQRDQMLRESSWIFITPKSPVSLFQGNPFKDVSSIELATGMKNVQYVSDFAAVDMRDFFEMINRPTHSAYVPMIKMAESPSPVLKISGTAVIHGKKMVGTLSPEQTMGLLWMRGKVKGASVQAKLNKGETIQVEIVKAKTRIEPQVVGGHLRATVRIDARGTLANVPAGQQVNKSIRDQVETATAESIKQQVKDCIDTLQQYHTDITKIGVTLYRNDPKAWHKVTSNWDEVFSNGSVQVVAKVHVYHPGLTDETVGKQTPGPGLFGGIGSQ